MRTSELHLSPTTRAFLEAYQHQHGQGVLFVGSRGSGLLTAAQTVASEITTNPSQILIVSPDEKGTISIERVRALYVETRSLRHETFVVIVDDAAAMSHDAQNAFLKLLEEPVDNVSFILTSHEPQSLLPTIVSRVQTVEFGKISRTTSESVLRTHHITDATALQQMLFIASGLPAELVRLATDTEHFAAEARLVRLARDFLTANQHKRLMLISQISGREEAVKFIGTIEKVLEFTVERDATVAKQSAVETLETVTSRLAGNGHVRTQLMYLAVNL